MERPVAAGSNVSRSLRLPGIVLGMGLGGFIDGIVLHQILQWHHLLSDTAEYPMTTLEGLEANTLADGIFHAGTWILTIVGLVMLWSVVRRSDTRNYGRILIGWTLAGWGIFNLVEGIVDHLIIQIHHVREDVENVLAWDLAFLGLGLALLILGVGLARSRVR